MKKDEVEKIVEKSGLKSRFEHPTAENLETFHGRVWDFWEEEVFQKSFQEDTVVVFAHGGVLREAI